MSNKIEVFVGAPIEIESEQLFLAELSAELANKGLNALIFANFQLPAHNPVHQIDFLVILDQIVCHIDLKNLSAPVTGTANGPWRLTLPDGTSKAHDGKNPYVQALDCKFAISDQMHRFAAKKAVVPKPQNGAKFYTTMESVVCVYPELMAGSDVPSNNKVRVFGYPRLIQFLQSTVRNPGWSLSDWTALAMDLGLIRQETAEDKTTAPARLAQSLVSDYCRRFGDFYGKSIRPLVPTTVDVGGARQSSSALRQLIEAGQHLQLVGDSGCGKSHHLLHLALSALDVKRVPILVRANEYDGRLSTLLDRSVAHLCPHTSREFVDAVSIVGRPMVLFVDGFNECPVGIQKSLLKDLQAFFLRRSMPIVVTTQHDIQLPEALCGTKVQFCSLDEDERRSILTAYATCPLPMNVGELCQPFVSAYELSLAADCLAELSGGASRTALFDAYCRRRCAGNVDFALARRTLSRIADVMREDLRSNLSVAEMWRIGEAALEEQQAPVTTLSSILSCNLLEVRQGRCTFRHELLQQYFESVALHHQWKSPDALSRGLRRPENREKIEFVLGMRSDVAAVRSCLEAAAAVGDAVRLLLGCLRGHFGELSRRIVSEDIRELFRNATGELEALDILLQSDSEPHIPFLAELANGRDWSAYEQSLLNAVSESVAQGVFLNETLRLLADTEAFVHRYMEQRLGAVSCKRSFRSNLFWQLVMAGPIKGTLPAASILRAVDKRFRHNVDTVVIDRLNEELKNANDLQTFVLYFILSVLRGHEQSFKQLLPKVLRRCWDVGIYHLQLKVLDCVRSSASVLAESDVVVKDELIGVLSDLHTSHWGLSTMLIEAMSAFDMVSSPVSAIEAREELRKILASPNDHEMQEAADTAVSRIFEDVFQGVYCEAIDELQPADRVKLFTMAALGAPSYSSHCDYLLQELIQLESPAALPAFRRFAQELDGESPFSQNATYSFVIAHVGCAHFCDEPVSLADLSNDNRMAWQCYGEVIFWMHRPGLTRELVEVRCDELWKRLETDLAFAAIDPLVRFGDVLRMRWKEDDNHPVDKLFRRYQSVLRRIVEFGLRNRAKLTSVDKRSGLASHQLREQTLFMIHTLGQIGNADSIELLKPFLDDSYFDRDAVEAIRRINSGRPFEQLSVTFRFP